MSSISLDTEGPGKKRIWHTDKKKKKADAEVEFKAKKFSSVTGFFFRDLIPAAVMILGLTFGAKWMVFDLTGITVNSIAIDTDLQLSMIGLINKVMDAFVQASIKNTASVLLTVWMALSVKGASLLDLQLKEELTQPWTCVGNFYKRCSRSGWKGVGFKGTLRFLLSLSVSCCVIFLGLAINTIAIPKERWWPPGNTGGYSLTDEMRKLMTVTVPRQEILGVDWMNQWNEAWDMIGSGPASWDAAAALVAASTYTFLSGIPGPYKETSPGWYDVGTETSGYITGVNTVINGTTVQTVSVQNAVVQDTFDYLKANGSHKFQRYAIGWNAILNITVPMLTTTCMPGLIYNNTIDNAIDSLFPAASWIKDQTGVAVSLNNWGSNKNPVPVTLDPSPENRACALALRDQINSITPRIDKMLDDGLVPHLVRTARRLAYLNHNLSAPAGDDAPSVTPVLALMAQHLLTIAEWNTTTLSSSPSSGPGAATTVSSYPVRWQIYASGPREAWEWAAVAILVVVLLAVLLGGLYGVVRRVEPGPWLEIAGFMLLANQSRTMGSAEGSVGGDASKKAKKARYYVRGTGGNDPALVLVDMEGLGGFKDVDMAKTYQSDGYVVIEKWEIDWRPWRRVIKAARAAWTHWTTRKPQI
ncbi:hypothetical protein VMCG_03734 [Cytospora schulzeri]|uniref:Uncharacterized protein n=1 Tax=Cytospora schulzeri TaxID=448051 RepID=A0A423WV36_9PEZI|nr:hypothetical protein VMCG_03734 [Valsa malicola]